MDPETAACIVLGYISGNFDRASAELLREPMDIDSSSEEEQEEEEKTISEIAEETLRGKIVLLGQGTYNRAYLIFDKSIVVRIAVSNQKISSIRRGIQISKYIYDNFFLSAGPSVLRIIESQQEWTNQNLPLPGLPNDHIYIWQKLELLKPKYKECNLDIVMFCLLWFIITMQIETGFRHLDIKVNNILIRETLVPQTFTFKIDGNKFYKFSTRCVPVLLDYDFAVFPTNEVNNQRQMGTPTYVPPERLLNVNLEPQTYDYWSLGITFLRLAGVEPFNTGLNKGKLYEYFGLLQNFLQKQSLDQRRLTTFMIQDIFHICILKKSLGDTLIPRNYTHRLFEGPFLEILESCETFQINISKNRLAIIRRLLSWDWAERDFHGYPHFYFNNSPFMFQGPCPDLVYCFEMSTKFRPYYQEAHERQMSIFGTLFNASFIDAGIKRDREDSEDSDDSPEKSTKTFREVPESARDVHNSPMRIRQFAYNLPIETLKDMFNGIFEDGVQEALSRENLFWFYVGERRFGPSRYEAWRDYKAYLAQAK